MKIGIIGSHGKMALGFTQWWQNLGHTVIGIDRHTTDYSEFAGAVDCIVICVPQSSLDEVEERLLPVLTSEHLVLDIVSRKRTVTTMLQRLHQQTGCRILPTHPVFGPSNISSGEVVVLCPDRDGTSANDLQIAREQLFPHMSCIEMTAAEHDTAMLYIQGLQHFLELVYSEFLRQEAVNLPQIMEISSPVYQLQMLIIGRILGHDEDLYGSLVHGDIESPELLMKFAQLTSTMAGESRDKYEERFRLSRAYFGNKLTQHSQAETDSIISLMERYGTH